MNYSDHKLKNLANIASFILSVVIIIACVCFLIITVILAVKPPKIEQGTKKTSANDFIHSGYAKIHCYI